MIVTRAQEIPDKVHVLFYDQVITYAQTNDGRTGWPIISKKKA